MKPPSFPSLKNMTDDEIYQFYDEKVAEKDCFALIYHLIEERPDTSINVVELFENTPEFDQNDYKAILEFAEHYRKIHPEKYQQEYEFVELELTDHAFDTMDKALISRCIEVIEQNPAKGIDTVTMLTLYRLIYFGMYREAVDYCEKVWKPISNSEEIWGQPEVHFLKVLYLNGAEEQYELICQGDTSGWKDFNVRMQTYGFDNEEERISRIFQALTSDLEKEKILHQIKENPGYGFIGLLYHFFKYMKHRYGIPFLHSNLLFYLMMDKSLFGSIKEEDAWFYIPYPKLDQHVTKNLDTFFRSNLIALGGKLWGLHYVYEFLHEHQLISTAYYKMMLENLAWLKMDFLTVAGREAWKLKFILNWPDTESNLLKLPDNFFESIDRKDLQTSILQIKNLLPTIDGKNRIANEIRTESRKKSNKNSDHVYQIAGEEIPPDPSRYVRRNDPCPCGSGKKHKNCCLGKK